jgi:hypothetical protein
VTGAEKTKDGPSLSFFLSVLDFFFVFWSEPKFTTFLNSKAYIHLNPVTEICNNPENSPLLTKFNYATNIYPESTNYKQK